MLSIQYLMNTPLRINDDSQRLVKNGVVDFNHEKEREKFFVSVLQSNSKDIYSFSYGTENGEYYGARRNEKGVIEIMKNDAETGGQSWYYSVNHDLTAGGLVVQAGKFDPRTRDWYKAAKATGKPAFSPIYKHFIMPDLTVSAAFPIYDENDQLKGVLGTHIILSNINDLLKQKIHDKNGYALIIEKNSGALVANSFGMDNFNELKNGQIQRIQISQIKNQTLVNAYNDYISTHKVSFKQKTIDNQFYINFTEYKQNGIEWIIMTALPESLLNKNILASMRNAYLFIIICVLLSILIYYFVTKWFLKPVKSLIKTAESISAGNFSQRVPVMRNDEFGRISNSFNKMADTIANFVNNLEITVKERTAEIQLTNVALKESKDQLRLILDSTAEGIFGCDLEGKCTFCNASCLEILRYKSENELLGKNMHWQIHHSKKDGTQILLDDCDLFQTILSGKKAHGNDEIYWRADGTFFDIEYYSYPQYKDGMLVGAVVTFLDITERKNDEDQIKYLSCHDSLTGLMNRRYFEEALEKYDVKDNLPLSIIFADINGLKLTNDIFGHTSGDELIRKAAMVLKNSCRDVDALARIGGDEFVILLPRMASSEAKKIIEKVTKELSKEKVHAIKCSMALGCHAKIDVYQDIEEIMVNAENEMYKEKALNRKTINAEMIHTIITTLHERSPQEKNHSIHVSKLCEQMGHSFNMPITEIKKLKDAGYYHDIGKIVFDKEIIIGEDELTEDITVIQQHSVVGYRILNLSDDTLDLADAIYSHHEKWDGTGYPKGLKGEEIPLTSRIISLAETYDRKMTDIDKNEPIKKEEAIQFMRENAGKRFDPVLVEAFIHMIENDKYE